MRIKHFIRYIMIHQFERFYFGSVIFSHACVDADNLKLWNPQDAAFYFFNRMVDLHDEWLQYYQTTSFDDPATYRFALWIKPLATQNIQHNSRPVRDLYKTALSAPALSKHTIILGITFVWYFLLWLFGVYRGTCSRSRDVYFLRLDLWVWAVNQLDAWNVKSHRQDMKAREAFSIDGPYR